MANEATVRSALQIRSGNLNYSSLPASFTADVGTAKGPTPGAVAISPYGTDIDLSQLTAPGLCRVMNLDSSVNIDLGIWDPEALKFYPLMTLLPGETYVIRLASDLAAEFGTGTGTGSTGPDTNTLRARAQAREAVLLVEAFES